MTITKVARRCAVALFAVGWMALLPLAGSARQTALKHFTALDLVGCRTTGDGCMSGQAAFFKRPANASLSISTPMDLEGSPARGAEHPRVTIVEFADYTCPYTIKMEPVLRSVVNGRLETVRLVIKHHWLAQHPHARLAAQVSVAADLQGKFWPVHEMMLDKHFASGKDGATIDGFVPYLRTVRGLDVSRLVRDVNSPEVNARVDRDLRALRSTATPQFIVNGRFFEGVVSEAQLKLLIDEASKQE